MQAQFTLSGDIQTYPNGMCPSIGILTDGLSEYVQLQITDVNPEYAPFSLLPENEQAKIGPNPIRHRTVTYFLKKSTARAIASAIMGAAAEL